jgi:CRP-like cAMP-binding protein
MSVTLPAKNLFLCGMTADDMSLLRAHLVPMELCVGDILQRCDDMTDQVIFPQSGVVILVAPVREGTGTGIALIGRDGFAGGFAAGAAAPATCDCEVLIAGQASKMSTSAFRFALDHSPTLRRWASQFDNALMAQAQQTALCSAVHSVEARICRWLLEVQDRSGSERVPLTQATLAQLLGVRRTTVTLVAGHLETAGAISCRRGFMQIIDRAALEQRCCACYTHLKSHAIYPDRVSRDPLLVVSGARTLNTHAT